MKLQNTLSALALAAMAIAAAPAQANSFACLTNNGTCAEAIAAADWSLTGDLLTISNLGPWNGVGTGDKKGPTITEIYFEAQDATFWSKVENSPGSVDYTRKTSGGNLPGGNNAVPPFVVGTWFDPKNPQPEFGVNPVESITFKLTGYTGTPFRMGLHMQQTTGGKSEGLITTVPEPETYALMLAGLAAVGFVARRRKGA